MIFDFLHIISLIKPACKFVRKLEIQVEALKMDFMHDE